MKIFDLFFKILAIIFMAITVIFMYNMPSHKGMKEINESINEHTKEMKRLNEKLESLSKKFKFF